MIKQNNNNNNNNNNHQMGFKGNFTDIVKVSMFPTGAAQ